MTEQNQSGPQNDQDQNRSDNGQPRERRPRDRNGRERGPRSDRPDRAPRDSQQPLEGFTPDAPEANAQSTFVEPAARASYFAAPSASPAATVNVEPAPAAQPVQAASAPQAQDASIAPVKPAPAPAPVVPAANHVPTAVTAPGLPKVQPFELPVESLSEVAQSSGLSWVNSDPAKIASVQAAIAAEPKPIRVPRERPAPVKVDAGPLVLVETKRDLRNMTLPFEQTTPQ